MQEDISMVTEDHIARPTHTAELFSPQNTDDEKTLAKPRVT
jgi:hypothetical protein